MFDLVKNVLRGVRKRLFQYLGIVVLLIIVVAAMTGLYGNSERVSSSFYTVAKNSGTYDYRINMLRLSDYRDIDTGLVRIKDILKAQFPNTLPNYATIVEQIDQIKNNDIQNNLLPTISNGTIDDDLKLLLLNWGVSYKSILINDILNNEVKDNEITSYYQIEKSFLKSFNFNQSKKIFFSFEDAFYINKLPPWMPNQNQRFNFSPFRDGFNKIYITGGKEPQAINEVIINPTFAKANGIALNDQVEFISDQPVKVVGFGYAYWGIIGELSADNVAPLPETTTQVFTTREWSNQYLGSSSTTKVETPFFLKVKNKDGFFASKIENIFSEFFNFNYGNLITIDTNDYRSGFLKQSFDMANIIYSSISFFVMLAAVFIVLAYVRKEIDIQKKQIGLIKALGYSNNEVSFGFTFLIFLISIISTAIGFALGLPLQMYFNGLNNFGYVLPLPIVHFSVIGLVIGVIVSTAIFTLASYLQSYSTLTKNPLTLIHDRTSGTSTKWLAFFKKPFSYWSFKPRLAISFALKSIGKLALIFFTFVFVSFLLLFQTIVTDIFDSKIGNLQNYVNAEVYLSSRTFNVYKFDSDGNIDPNSKIYNWTLEKDLDPAKAILSDSFHIDSQEKRDKLMEMITDENFNFKDYYMKTEEMNLLYKNIKEQEVDYIRPPGTDFISVIEANITLTILNQLFDTIIGYSGMDPTTQPLPGFSAGQMIINNNYYPNLEFVLNTPAEWIGHNQGPLVSQLNQVITLYNNSDQNNPLAWKNWFNFKEERGLDIDPIFNSSHNLTQQSVTYVDSFGQTKTQNAYVVPSVISKSLAVLNKYKVGDQVLMILNTSATFVPIIFEIKGINITNLDMSHFYVQIDDLRRVIGYTNNGQPIQDAFNNYYSKDETVLPLNSINIVQPNDDYTRNGLLNSWSLINRDPIVFSLLKGRLIEMFQSVQNIVNITKWLTIIALAFVLVIIINMILDNNILIIAMMKALGYRINEINGLIIGSYIFALILAFIIGAVLGYVTWWLILLLVAKLASTIFLLPISAVTILISFALVFLVLIIGYAIGLYFIKFKPVTSLLQSE